MATIKAGTYRFNDVLTQGRFYEDVNELNEVYFNYQTVAVTNGESVTLYCSAIYQEPFEVGSGSLSYICSSSDPDLTSLGITYPFGRYVYNGSYGTPDSDSWDYTYGTGIQIITITNDQEVTAGFLTWFTANAVEYKKISGVWKFNDELTVPVDPVSEVIYFTSNIGEDGSILAKCSAIGMALSDFGGSSIPRGISLFYYVDSLEPNPGFEVPNEYDVYFATSTVKKGWYTDSYGEGIKTLDFGTEPQFISAPLYDWFTANAEEVQPELPDREISGAWKFNEILYLPDHDIVQNVTFKTQGFIEAFEGYEDAKIWDCSRMRITAGYVQYYVDSTVPDFGGRPRYEYVYTAPDGTLGLGWVEDSLRVVDFGTTPQTVSGEFYNWVIANSEQTIAGYPFPIELYKNRAEPNRVDKTNYITKIGTMLGTMREESSITDLTITFESDSVPTFNYIYVPIFNRYYFVADIKSLGFKMWQMSLEVDVLMTYKDAILNCKGFVERNEFTFNNMLIDKKRVIEQGYNITVDEVENDVFRNPASSESTVDIMYVVNGYKIDSVDSV